MLTFNAEEQRFAKENAESLLASPYLSVKLSELCVPFSFESKSLKDVTG